MEIVEVFVTDMADAMVIENGTAAKFRVFNVSDYHEADLFTRLEQVVDTEILLRYLRRSRMTSLRASFCM